MTAVIRAELQRLLRRRTIVVAAAASAAFAVVTTLTVVLSATDGAAAAARRATTIAELSTAAGATEAFAIGASFVGFLVFVTFIALVATEFSGGTYRALLLRDPHRVRLLAGKVVAALVVAAGALVLAEGLSVVLSFALAPSQGVDTGAWLSLDALGRGVGNLATAFAGVAGWAIFGTTLAVVFRSVPLALAVGFAWTGPFENILVDSWSTGYRIFPGQVLAAIIQGGTVDVSLTRAIATAALYVGIAAATTATLLRRRDVTA